MRRLCVAVVTLAFVAVLAPAASASVPTELGSKAVKATARVSVPQVVGLRMDRATRRLRNAGLRVNEECSGLFGCIVKSRWWVCSQDPRPGTKLRRYAVVVIYAERRGEC